MYLCFVDLLNVGCFDCGLPALEHALPPTFLWHCPLLSASSVLALTTVLPPSLATWITACFSAIFSLLCSVCLSETCLLLLTHVILLALLKITLWYHWLHIYCMLICMIHVTVAIYVIYTYSHTHMAHRGYPVYYLTGYSIGCPVCPANWLLIYIYTLNILDG